MSLTKSLLLVATFAALSACSESSSAAPPTVTQLSLGDTNCPGGGVAITSGATTAYACSGADGQTGVKGDQGLQGPAGDPGLPGPPGGGLYTSRNDVYCREAIMPDDPAVTSITVSCDSDLDLPLVGSCEGATGVGAEIMVNSSNSPNFWQGMNIGNPANWNCGWAIPPFGGTNNPFSRARICCIKHP